jgi:lysophospholipase L1-like esterase
MIVLCRIFKGIISIIICLIILEVLLQISSLVYIKSKYRIKNLEILKDNSLRIMFIGDSWTQGAEAAPRPGYVDLTIEKLNRLYPNKNIQGYNFAWGSTNSSQAIHQFLDHYHNIKPHILVVMTGANNGWNTQDILTARKRIKNMIQINDNAENQENIKFTEYLINTFKKLKIIKLYNLISYNIVYKSKEIKIPFADNEYVTGYNRAFDTEGPEKAREYLINNYKEGITDYNQLYRLMLHSFGGNINNTLDYLRNKNIYKPRLIKDNIDVKYYERYKGLPLKILEDNLTDLKLLCDQEGIITVIKNYPHIKFKDFNRVLAIVAQKTKCIYYVDHYRYFESNVGYEEWDKIITPAHVNYKGHEYMADNLTSILSDIILD